MKTLSAKEAQALQLNWQELRQETIVSSFEVFNQEDREYDRITARDFGQITQDFMDAVNAIDTNSLGSGLSLCIGVDATTGKTEVIWEVNLNGEKSYFQGDQNLFVTYIGEDARPTVPHMGESVNYKNEVCSNWANMPYFEMSTIFFINLPPKEKMVNGQEQFLGRPRRVLKFVLPKSDIQIIQQELATSKSILVHYGVNYGDAARQLIPFVPLIQIYTPNVKGVLQDDPDSTYLDFVEPCPPNCPD